MNHDQADLLMKGIGMAGTVLAFAIAVYQYRRGQNWQKANILLSLMDQFKNEKNIQAACEMLDYDGRRISLGGTKVINFSNEKLITALRVEPVDLLDTFTEEERVIRDAFDSFFDFFHKLYSFERNNLLTFNDFTYFYYYLELLRDVEKYKREPGLGKIMTEYIDKYHFIGVKFLIREYEKNPTPLEIMENKAGT